MKKEILLITAFLMLVVIGHSQERGNQFATPYFFPGIIPPTMPALAPGALAILLGSPANTHRITGHEMKGNTLTVRYWGPAIAGATPVLPGAIGIAEYQIVESIPPVQLVRFGKNKFGIAAVNVPFKCRFKVGGTPGTVETDIKNIGAQFGFKHITQRYYGDGDQFTHGYLIGGFVGLTSIKLTSANTREQQKTDLTQAAASVGFALSYNYRKISLTYIPLACDISLGSDKGWIYNGRWWMGLGITIDGGILGI